MPILTKIPNSTLTITAKVDAVINATDFLEWTHDFMPNFIYDYPDAYQLNFDGVHQECSQATQSITTGIWSFSVTSGICDSEHPVRISYKVLDQGDEILLTTLTALNETVELIVKPYETDYIYLVQTGTTAQAVLTMTRIAYEDSNGDLPTITTNGDTLTTTYNYTPRPGVFTATAKVYDGNGFLIATSAAITLNITSGGGGGS